MTKTNIFFFFVMIFLFDNCWNGNDRKSEKVDTFYSIFSGRHWRRVPLIKPYDVEKANPEIESEDWFVRFEHINGADKIEKVFVKDSIIYLYCGDSTLVDGVYMKSAWYIIDVEKKKEMEFVEEAKFFKNIKENHYPLPKWINIDSLFYDISHGAKLPWRPQ